MPCDVSQLDQFAANLGTGGERLRQMLPQYLDMMGVEFLRIVQDEILSVEAVDTRLLLASFQKGGAENIYEISNGGLTLKIGTNVEYASYVNDGHAQQAGRFIPGSWSGERFIYTPGASTGMVLKASYVEGKHFWESAVQIFESILPNLVDRLIGQMIESML